MNNQCECTYEQRSCTTCRYSNEWHEQSIDTCGTCLDLSVEGNVDFPLYIPSLKEDTNASEVLPSMP